MWPNLAVAAAETRMFNVAPGPLGGALVAFGEQAGMTVGLNDPALAGRHSPGARGKFSRIQALRRILAGTGARFRSIDRDTVRVVRARPEQDKHPSRPRLADGPALAPPAPMPEIVVTASKRNLSLRNHPGTVSIVDFDPDELARESAKGTAAIVSRLPILASTNLGSGRNKIFIRGVADSSFNGASPATVGQYLGDVRLTYNAPDPDLNLYDMRRVEVLEGPQGTLYGSGSLGGILRLVPNPPAMNGNSGSMAAGATATAHGGEGGDIAGMVNLVPAPGRAALRLVAFASLRPGYIDDPGRNLTNINRTTSQGGRAAFEFKAGGDWTVALGGAMQNVRASDGQYVLRGFGLERSSAVAQPFDNDFSLAYVTAKRPLGPVELTTTTSFVRHDVDSAFDATLGPSAPPRLYTEQLSLRLFSHETRLSRNGDGNSWVFGLSGFIARDMTRRAMGAPRSPAPIAGFRNANKEAAVFGQFTHQIASRIAATLGARLSYTHSSGELIDTPSPEADEPARNQFRFSPTAALTWNVNERLLAYIHAQSASRPGLLEVAPSSSPQASERVDSDSLSMIELGARFGRRGTDRLIVDASIAHQRWSDIQSDLIDPAGLPFTANIGDGRITSIEASATWRVTGAVVLDAALFVNSSRLAKPAPRFTAANERDLPNIGHVGGRFGAVFRHQFNLRTALTVNGSVRYVGRSELGIGAPLDVSQGDYVDTALGARLALGGLGLSLDVTNLADTRGNRFAYGNPFGINQRNQITPLAPRRVRIGVDVKF